jgi:hypothetical protein
MEFSLLQIAEMQGPTMSFPAFFLQIDHEGEGKREREGVRVKQPKTETLNRGSLRLTSSAKLNFETLLIKISIYPIISSLQCNIQFKKSISLHKICNISVQFLLIYYVAVNVLFKIKFLE